MLIIHTPHSDANAVIEIQASLGDSLVVGSGGARNVELSDSDLGSDGGKSLESVGSAAGRREVRLGACNYVSSCR